MIQYTATYTDLYQLAMAQVYFLKDRHRETAIFDYFFRKLPFSGGYAVFAGLETLLEILENLRFDECDLAYLREQGFDETFVDYLADFRFSGEIRSRLEGEVVFPTAPILQVEANLLEAQIIETVLLNVLNFQTLIATKARRMQSVANNKTLIEFGLRRSQGPGGYYAARAAVVGGFAATSNVWAGRDMGIAISGTMAHSFIQSYDDELTAFRDFAEARPIGCVLLVDTYDTLRSGVPNAITVALEMRKRGEELLGIRLDSGDLAYLARESRKMLDNAGLQSVQIVASNQLDEHIIKSLNEQRAPIDVFGVGTSVAVGKPDAALDGVYKLSVANNEPRIKRSENREKVSIPGKKQVYRMRNSEGTLIGGDVIALHDELQVHNMIHPFYSDKTMSIETCKLTPLLQPVLQYGKRVSEPRSLDEIAEFSARCFAELPEEYVRFDYPHEYKIGLSDGLHSLRESLLRTHKVEKK